MHTEKLIVHKDALSKKLHPNWKIVKIVPISNSLRHSFELENKVSGETAFLEFDEIIGFVGPYPVQCF